MKENKNEKKNDYIHQFHYKGNVCAEHLKVTCGTPGFCRTQCEYNCCTERIKEEEFNKWTPPLITPFQLK